MYKKILFIALFSFAIGQHHNHDHSLTDDGYIRCATDELEKELQISNPEFQIHKCPDVYSLSPITGLQAVALVYSVG